MHGGHPYTIVKEGCYWLRLDLGVTEDQGAQIRIKERDQKPRTTKCSHFCLQHFITICLIAKVDPYFLCEILALQDYHN